MIEDTLAASRSSPAADLAAVLAADAEARRLAAQRIERTIGRAA